MGNKKRKILVRWQSRKGILEVVQEEEKRKEYREVNLIVKRGEEVIGRLIYLDFPVM